MDKQMRWTAAATGHAGTGTADHIDTALPAERAGTAVPAERAGTAVAAESAGQAGSGAAENAGHDARHRSDTRARIQRVALELFAEQGYDKTSLREIAERLDVTKAALYYHFKSKEDIVHSLVEDYMGQVDALIAWAKSQPRTPQTRSEILRRYVQIVADGSDVFRMIHHNQAAVNSLAATKQRGSVFRERMSGLVEAITEPEADLPERLRVMMALGSVSVGWMFFAEQVKDRNELCAAIRGIAADLINAQPN
jgi:AcrR family transcriptional regulator